MHTPALTNLAAPAIEKVTPAVEQIKPALTHALDEARDHVPGHLPRHLPDLTSHLPGRKRRGPVARTRRYAREHRKALLLLALAALAGGAAGWYAMRRGAGWAPTHSGSTDSRESRQPTSGYARPDLATTGAAGSDGGYADRGADDGFGGAAIGGTAEVSEGPFGAGSAEPLADGSAPGAAYTIKGDEVGKVFHTRQSPDYATTTASVWFSDVETARAAGFAAWDDK